MTAEPRQVVVRGPALPAIAAACAVLSAVLHVLTAWSSDASGAVVMTVLALACAGCAADVWRRPEQRAWTMMLVFSAAMVLAHAVFGHGAASSGAVAVGQHAHTAPGTPGGLFMSVALWLAVAEMVLASAALLGRRGRNR
ncbi:hypothetical protein [Jiangella endophytica]|uniref:hypothetical protein n=1 Tax=Jiangella endophytica TaxID=1623398 RepID=UPI001300477F|nr:hypothetical protein [Jiangella endophytica]